MRTDFTSSVTLQPCSDLCAVLQLFTDHLSNPEALRFATTDNVVGLLGECPELTHAVREGDVSMVSVLCAKLFESQAG